MICQPLPASGEYLLLDDLRFEDGIVPIRFAWDGASIPRAVWSTLGYSPFHPAVMRASCVHDHLYTVRTGTRRAADELFREILIEDGVQEHVAAMMFAAVRQFGVLTWEDDEDRAARKQREQRERERVEQAP